MQRTVFLLIFFICFGVKVSSQDNSYKNIQPINYCEIIKNPQSYNGKSVKVFAEHRSGVEFSGLGSQTCASDFGKIWAEWENYESCGDEETARLLINRNKGIENNYLEGIFVGKFFVQEDGKSGFGHMNAKPFKLLISCVESATLLPKENSGCTRVDETSPFHYLQYVKTELEFAPNYDSQRKKKKKEKIVWFRLVNNSSCPIIVPTIESQMELQNESKIKVVYNLDPTIKTSQTVLGSPKSAIKKITNSNPTRSILPAGKSIYFAVSVKLLKKKLKIWRNRKSFWNISVPFDYADRQKESGYDPFYFSRSNLPKELFEK